ncbi:MAG TPA: hypothetical protein VMT00_06350 [Thermoanaerobaculia bacterium]|nr:hypothetical protein [Thermoanaerobaculia bacterium]
MGLLVDNGLEQSTREIYRNAIRALGESGIDLLVGGAYAFEWYTGIARNTKDFDIFLRQQDLEPALERLADAGFRTKMLFPHWLGKAYAGDEFIDLIYGAGNGIALVDDQWFEHAVVGEVLGIPVTLCPPEEMIWSKAFIMERERFDGADVAHLIKACGRTLDWNRLLARFAPFPRLLLAHLILFGFIYPDLRDNIPEEVMDGLLVELRRDPAPSPGEKICFGTLLSRAQYIADIGRCGYKDARLQPIGTMSPEDVAYWTAMIQGET